MEALLPTDRCCFCSQVHKFWITLPFINGNCNSEAFLQIIVVILKQSQQRAPFLLHMIYKSYLFYEGREVFEEYKNLNSWNMNTHIFNRR